jgi:hypothetical protein
MRDTSKPLVAGDLRHTVMIVAPAGVLAATESEVDSGVPTSIVVAPNLFQRTESLAVGGLQAQTVYTVSVRYRTDLSPAYTLVEECCTQRRFQIVAIVPSDRRDAVDMTCVTAG